MKFFNIIKERKTIMDDNNLQLILNDLLDKKASDVVYIDVSEVNPLARFYIICTATSNRHALALAQNLKELCYQNQITIHNVEGKSSSDWVLVDANDYIIHIFTQTARLHYGLEKLWSNLKIIKVE